MTSAIGLPNKVIAVTSRESLDQLFSDHNAGSPFRGRLVSFATDVIVPARYLSATRPTPVNFHPGPPEYPGLRALEFALHDGVTSYGVTAHVMTLPVDSGPIIGVNRFAASDGDEDALRFETWRAAYALLMHLLPALAAEEPLRRIDASWSTRICSDAAWRALQAEDAHTGS